MAGRKLVILVICLLTLPAALHAEDSLQTTSYMGFNPFTNEMDLSLPIVYKFPNPALYGDGPFPLFIWVPGTFETYTDIQALTFVAEMSARGFVGASIQYNDVYPIENCTNYKRRARAIFDSSRSTSAISVLCHISGVNCERGAVVAGISQGAALSILASNYSPIVKAVY